MLRRHDTPGLPPPLIGASAGRRARHVLEWMLAISGVTIAAACATTKDYVIFDGSQEVNVEGSAFHDFEYVKLVEEDGGLVVYGKVFHHHEPGTQRGYVDVTYFAEGSRPTLCARMPLSRGSRRLRGLRGAAFRGRIDGKLDEVSEIRLSLVDYPEGHAASESRCPEAGH